VELERSHRVAMVVGFFVGGSYEGVVMIQFFVSNCTNYFWNIWEPVEQLRGTRGDVFL
jgi:hypothetical protein